MTETSTPDPAREPASTPRAPWAYGTLGMAVVFGVFASGGPLQVAQGAMAVAAGIGLLVAAPSVALPRWWWATGGAVVTLAALAFLPREWGYDPEWRRQIDALGVPTGTHITAHPAVSLQHWLRLLVTVGIGLWILGHRLTDRGQARILLGVAWAAGLYAVLSVALEGRSERWAWDPVETFGLFANRSHTATLLVIGVLSALTVGVYHFRHGHGGRAALVTLPGVFCAGALLGCSISRAGILLLGLGLVAWMAGHAVRGFSRRSALAGTLLAVAVAGLFWFSDAEIKSRLLRPAPLAAAGAPAPDSSAPLELDLGLQQDGRWFIFRDTLDLIRDSWLTGTGRGMFEHVIPQYRRRSACESRCLHPESDWLLLASEAGVPCALALAALVGGVAAAVARSAWKRRGWSLRWGGLVTALIVPVHGVFDTPGHLPVLGLLTLLLAASCLRASSGQTRHAGPGARLAARLAGVLALSSGAYLLRAEWKHEPSPVVAAPLAIDEASRLYAEDQAALRAAAAPAPADPADDLLRRALVVVENGLRFSPLDTTLHYQRGMLALHFDDMDATADQAFAVQRQLEPMPPGVALRQAQGWISIDPERAARLWEDALRRAEATDRVTRWLQSGTHDVHQKILSQARASDALMRRALDLFRASPDHLRAWAQSASAAVLDAEMPALLAAAAPDDRRSLFEIWKARGSRGAAEAHQSRPPGAAD